MVSKQKVLRYLSYTAILLVIVFLAYFIKETEYVFDTLSVPGKVGGILFIVGIVWLIVRSLRFAKVEKEAEKDKSRYYIFRVEKHPQYSRLYLDDFMDQYGMGEDFFWQTVAVPAINDAMDEYRKKHPKETL